MLGIDDPLVWLAFVGAIGVTFISVVYGLVRRNAAPDEVAPEDRQWAIAEKKVDDEL